MQHDGYLPSVRGAVPWGCAAGLQTVLRKQGFRSSSGHKVQFLLIVIAASCKRRELNQINFTIKEILKLIYSAVLPFLFMKP